MVSIEDSEKLRRFPPVVEENQAGPVAVLRN